MGTPKESTVIFEDSFFAATTAKKAGFTVVGVYDKFEKATKELEKLADVYVRDTRELMGLIGG
jgi:beta-phosphoglucomutase-like phosphatase (HAD superfamily)